MLTNGLGANVNMPSQKIVKSFADNQSMRKQKAAGVDGHVEQAACWQKQKSDSVPGCSSAADEVQPITHEGDSFQKLTA